YRPGETYVFGGISSGGKTILTMQMAKDFAMQGINTVVLTTERPPWSLLMRCLSNHLSLDFSSFNRRVIEASRESRVHEVTIKFIPQEIWQDPKRYDLAR